MTSSISALGARVRQKVESHVFRSVADKAMRVSSA
jgi:hypothetical protein